MIKNNSSKLKKCILVSMLVMVIFMTMETLITFGVIPPTKFYMSVEYILFWVSCLPICIFSYLLYRERENSEKFLREQLFDIENKNTYLEHAAKILRHDMHAGINTYIPRGITSLKRRIPQETIKDLKLESPMRMLTEGLEHSQKVYKGIYEFTNLVRKDHKLERQMCNIHDILFDFLSSTAYASQVVISDNLPVLDVNEPLFCTAVDNLVRNGLKYNDSDSKKVEIYPEENSIVIQDNGRGMTNDEFIELSKPYTRKKGQKEAGTGLGLGICVAIMKEHGFDITCEKNAIGTKMKIHAC